MKNFTKIIAGVISAITLAFQLPQVQQAVGGFFAAHPNVSALLAGLAAILALVHNPAKQ